MRKTSVASALVLMAIFTAPAAAQRSDTGPQFSPLAGSHDAVAATGGTSADTSPLRGPTLVAPPVIMTTTALRKADGRIEHRCEQLPSNATGEPVIRSAVPGLERRQ